MVLYYFSKATATVAISFLSNVLAPLPEKEHVTSKTVHRPGNNKVEGIGYMLNLKQTKKKAPFKYA